MKHRRRRNALLAAAAAFAAAAVLLAAPRAPNARSRTSTSAVPSAPPLVVSNDLFTVFVRPGTHCWNGACTDEGGIVTLTEPLTVSPGTTLTLYTTYRNPDLPPPDRLDVTAYRADDVEWVADDGLARRWRARGAGVPLAIRAGRLATMTAPAQAGGWVLDVHARWRGEAAGDVVGDVHWGVWLATAETIDRAYHGLFQQGFEFSLFAPGGRTCPRDGPTLDLQTGPLSGPRADGYALSAFSARYLAIAASLSRTSEQQGHFDGPPVEVAFHGVLAPLGANPYADVRRRLVVVTHLDAMTPTLRCGMDAPDLYLVEATVADAGCVYGTRYERFAARVTNIGTQPAGPFAVEAHAGSGGDVVRWAVGGLAVGAEVALTATRQMRMDDPPVTSFLVDARHEIAERFDYRNNASDGVARPRTRRAACPTWAAPGASRRIALPWAAR